MKFKDRLKDKYYLLMICSLIVTILWTWWGYTKCANELDELILVIYAMGFMAVPYIVKRYHLLDTKLKEDIDFDGGRYWLSLYKQ
jgi:hypothetical protein